MKKNIVHYFLFLAAVLLLLAGCSSNSEKSSEMEKDAAASTATHKDHTYHAENGDLRELTAGVDTIPSFLGDKSEQMQIIYAAAAQHQDLLEYIPCYCGCAESGNHQNALNCFVFESKENGEVVWDDHGTRCGVCLETASESIIQYNDGKSIKEIRDFIDEKYKEGYSKPTPTKLPQEASKA